VPCYNSRQVAGKSRQRQLASGVEHLHEGRQRRTMVAISKLGGVKEELLLIAKILWSGVDATAAKRQ